MADYGVVMGSDCNVSCLDTSVYVTVENTRLVSAYLCFEENDNYLQDTNNVTIRVYIGNYIPYILESNPHPNLIRTSFCRFLKRKKKISSRF